MGLIVLGYRVHEHPTIYPEEEPTVTLNYNHKSASIVETTKIRDMQTETKLVRDGKIKQSTCTRYCNVAK